jgi:hypothetical protein
VSPRAQGAFRRFMRDIQLNPGIPSGKWARLRPLCGHDETLIDNTGMVDAIGFIDRLLTEASGTTVRPGRAADLAVSDFDRLCASIYVEYFGEVVEGRVACSDCHDPFDMRFSLLSLMQNLADQSPEISGPDEQGVFTSTDGRRFRLPTSGEQREVTSLGTNAAMAALLDRCVLDGDRAEPLNTIEKSLEQVGPVLDLDLNAVCPHCETVQIVRFDIQSYLFRSLAYERQFLNYEVHCIAMAYGWGYDEILSLTREDRRTFVGLIQSARPVRRRMES